MEDENTGSQVKVPVKKPPRERKKRSPVWVDYEVSRNGDGKKIANCKKCRQEFVAESTDGTTHLKRHLRTCPRREDGAPPPITEPPNIPAAPSIAVGAPPEASICGNPADTFPSAPSPIAAPSTIPAAPPNSIGSPPEASSCGNLPDSDGANADLAIPAAPSPPTPAPPPIDAARPEQSNCIKNADWEEATADLARMIVFHGYDPSIVEDSYFKSFVRRLNPDFQVPSRAAIEDICDGVQDDAHEVLVYALQCKSSETNLVIDRTETALGPVLYIACHFIDDDWNRRQMILHVNMDMDLPEGMGPMPLFLRGYDLSNKYHVDELGQMIYLESFSIWSRAFSMMIGPVRDLKEHLLGTRYETICNPCDVLQMVASYIHDSVLGECLVETIYNYGFALLSVTRQKREQFYSQHGLDYLLSYEKQWYSRYCSLRVLQEHDSLFSSTILSELMCRVWGEIYIAIKTISDPKHPTSHIVLRELFKVRETLRSEIAQLSECEAYLYSDKYPGLSKDKVIGVLVTAEEILVEGITKSYLQWSIPLVLDPRYKLMYIRFLFRSEAEEYIFNVIEEIKKVFTSFSINIGGTSDEDQIHGTDMTTAASAHRLEQAWAVHRQHSEVTKTELDRYLEGPLIGETYGFDILNWWELNSSIYPTLARMARAALAMPTCRKLSSELMSQITNRIRGYSKY